jgi:uncharacterized protein with ACT and thioredoxin-like domain
MISAYLIDEIVIKNLVSLDQWNEPTWATVTVKGRIEWASKLIRNAQGEQVVSAALVYFGSDVAGLTIDDRIVIDGVEHAIMRVDKKTDFSLSHWEVWIQ